MLEDEYQYQSQMIQVVSISIVTAACFCIISNLIFMFVIIKNRHLRVRINFTILLLLLAITMQIIIQALVPSCQNLVLVNEAKNGPVSFDHLQELLIEQNKLYRAAQIFWMQVYLFSALLAADCYIKCYDVALLPIFKKSYPYLIVSSFMISFLYYGLSFWLEIDYSDLMKFTVAVHFICCLAVIFVAMMSQWKTTSRDNQK